MAPLQRFRCLTTVGVLFTIVCTYSGVFVLLTGVLMKARCGWTVQCRKKQERVFDAGDGEIVRRRALIVCVQSRRQSSQTELLGKLKAALRRPAALRRTTIFHAVEEDP